MPDVRTVLEFDRINPVFTADANASTEYEFNAPEGYVIWSWGFATLDEHLTITGAVLQPGGSSTSNHPTQFVGIVLNTDSVAHLFKWSFVLLKL